MATSWETRLRVATADPHDRDEIFRARHDVYADELGQYEASPDGVLRDAENVDSTYIVASVGGRMVGFVGVTPPESPRFSVDRHLARGDMPLPFDNSLFEVRALTVLPGARGSVTAGVLMYAAFRWVEAHGGTRIVAAGRREVLDMYLRIGLEPAGRSFRSGDVDYDLIAAPTGKIANRLARFEARLRRLEDELDWQLGIAFRAPAECYHGGAFFEAIGDEFRDLDRRHEVINADVLDAWYAPAPSVLDALREHAEWLVRTSPPTHAAGLTRVIGEARGVEPASVLAGPGSSGLIFLALRQWLEPTSRVLILDPTYGEYAHVLERIAGCAVERFHLERDEGYLLDSVALSRRLAGGDFDWLVWVNPNSPTGRHVPRAEVECVLRDAPGGTRIWIDETYVDFTGGDQSLERFAASSRNTIVCKSMSKAYALSGMRVGYLCGPRHWMDELRPLLPPWSVSLPAQVAAARALQSPAYYADRFAETHRLRERLAAGLRGLGIREIVPAVANYLLFHIPEDAPDAGSLIDACRAEGLFLRDAGKMGTGMGDRAIRIAVKDAITNRRMLAILGQVLSRNAE
jgi:histidinol-phosphate/aromatic aminotransferase/cobyric acid decarboxylase-like protein/GNAT superfamily N-acetyltransferase